MEDSRFERARDAYESMDPYGRMAGCECCDEERRLDYDWRRCECCERLHCGCHDEKECAEEAEEAAKRRHVFVEAALYVTVAVLFALCVLAVMR